jgi:hypothetical protein
MLGLNSSLAFHYLNLARTDLAKSDPSSTCAHYRGRRSAKTQEKSRSAGVLDTPAGARMSKKSSCHPRSRRKAQLSADFSALTKVHPSS